MSPRSWKRCRPSPVPSRRRFASWSSGSMRWSTRSRSTAAISARSGRSWNALHDLVDGAAREATLAHVGSRQSEITERLDELIQRTPDRRHLAGLTEEIATVRRAIESADSPRSLARLEMSVSELARAVEAALNARQAAVDASVTNFAAGLDEIRRALDEREQTAVARLEGRLDEIGCASTGSSTARRPPTSSRGLSRRLEGVAARMDSLGKRGAVACRARRG